MQKRSFGPSTYILLCKFNKNIDINGLLPPYFIIKDEILLKILPSLLAISPFLLIFEGNYAQNPVLDFKLWQTKDN